MAHADQETTPVVLQQDGFAHLMILLTAAHEALTPENGIGVARALMSNALKFLRTTPQAGLPQQDREQASVHVSHLVCASLPPESPAFTQLDRVQALLTALRNQLRDSQGAEKHLAEISIDQVEALRDQMQGALAHEV